ncbi:hypothetical protein NZ698_02410 [Chryseobacterium sp. PBS4-4]|uniref:Uncharacterized protein n=1 Tax=Chryseobacterium edaphi TaxID=2976532 RepID=A0ABT2W1C7_9FLAO|nr:hypothetical protein [Chryseobacterium edaphi]MCU7616038.1 hypothetical protein [Chryseobacterium edaphi]
MKPTLQLPQTIRFPNQDEIPMSNSAVAERFEASKTANIVQGYTLNYNNHKDADLQGFNFYSEININNSNLWNVILALSKTLPEEVSVLFGHIDSDLKYGFYKKKSIVLEFLEKYKTEITQDAFINFGLIYNDDDILIEIFVDESKYIKYWGNDEESFRKILNDFGIAEVDNLEFIDEFPKVRESLKHSNENVVDSHELIGIFFKKYL